VLQQLGVYDNLHRMSKDIEELTVSYEDGTFVKKIPSPNEKLTGFAFIAFRRKLALEVLLEGIKDKSKCLNHAKAVLFREDDSGVEVTCADGTVYKGDILVGADGIHSPVREFMYSELEKTDQKHLVAKSRKGLRADYTCVFGYGPKVPGLESVFHTALGDSRSAIIYEGKDHLFYFIFEKIPTVFAPNIPRYTQEDAKKTLESIGSVLVLNRVTMRQVVENSIVFTKQALEEHLFFPLFSARTCIMGDALHKMTPNDALGGVMAIESAVCLANSLNQHLHRTETTPLQQTKRIFEQFSVQRVRRVKFVIWMSAFDTRVHAGANALCKFFRRYLVPILPPKLLIQVPLLIHANGYALDYLPLPKHTGEMVYHDEKTDSGVIGWLPWVIVFCLVLWNIINLFL